MSSDRPFRVAPLLRSLALVAIALLGFSPPSPAAVLTPSFVERSIVADALSTTGAQFSGQVNGDAGTGSLPFDDSVAAAAPTDDAFADGQASQESVINAASVRGQGQASASAEVGGGIEQTDASGSGETGILLQFTVDVETTFTVIGLVEASLLPDIGEAIAIVELVDLDAVDTLFSFQASDGESTAFNEMVTLLPGVSYELFASALAIAEQIGPGPSSESASASFQFQLVPEPGTFALLGSAMAALGFARRRRRTEAADTRNPR